MMDSMNREIIGKKNKRGKVFCDYSMLGENTNTISE